MTAVFVLRHPQTTWNAESRYQGRLEAPVSSEGQLQSRLVARAFAAGELAAVFSSPLTRAVYLGRELAQATDTPLILDARLTEIAMGPWEGLYLDQIKQRYPEMYDAWYSRPDLVRFPGGESLTDVYCRAASAMNEMYRRFTGGSVAIVTHSAVVQVLVASAIGLDFRYVHRLPVHNASVTGFAGTTAPGSLLWLNSIELLYHSPLASAAAQAGVS
jgi:probable phosphoglycerate mutase